jgi:hypothetical protein
MKSVHISGCKAIIPLPNAYSSTEPYKNIARKTYKGYRIVSSPAPLTVFSGSPAQRHFAKNDPLVKSTPKTPSDMQVGAN